MFYFVMRMPMWLHSLHNNAVLPQRTEDSVNNGVFAHRSIEEKKRIEIGTTSVADLEQ